MATESDQEIQNVRLFGDVFLYDEDKNKSECILMKNGKKCGTFLTSRRAYNLRRHVTTVHADFKANIIENNCTLNLSSTYIHNACVEMVTVNGRPFASLTDSGFLKLINPLLDFIEKKHGERIHITKDIAINHMKNICEQIRQCIMNETKDSLVSVMIDTATRSTRSILGVNIQYIIDGRIVVRTLKMMRLNQKHTGKYLATAVVDTLKEFNISVHQIYSQTTDNAANVLLSSKILDELAETENANDENPLTFEEIEEEFFIELLKEVEREFFQVENIQENVMRLPCGEHTFQLAFNDALDACDEATNLMQKVRNVAKKLRTPNIINALKEKKLNFPLIDNDTRWTGKQKMAMRLLELRDFIDLMAIADRSLRITETEWKQIEKICDTMTICLSFTIKTQAEQMTMSGFYAEWIALKLALKKKIDCKFASNLVECMNIREKKIFENSTLLAALFLDSRYRLFLKDKPMEKHTAMTHLTRIWKRLHDLKPSTPIDVQEPQKERSNDHNDYFDELDCFLTSIEETPSSRIQSASCDKIASALQKFDDDMAKIKRDDRKKHPMDFWEENKNKYPDIYPLARVIFAAAPTQVSVERCFSALAFILNKYRFSLTDENLNNILFVRLNKQIFENIVKDPKH